MKLTIDKSIKDILPSFDVIAYEIEFMDDYSPITKSESIDNILDNIYVTYPKKYQYDEITKISKLKETRDGYKKLGKDPSHTRPAAEALLRRVVKGNKLYRLGDVIDLGNILSIMTLRSVCVVDSNLLVGDVEIRLGMTCDKYEGINRGLINVSNIPLYTDNLGGFGCPTSDNLRTMVTCNTKKILIMIICFEDTDKLHDEGLLVELFKTNTLIKNMIKIK